MQQGENIADIVRELVQTPERTELEKQFARSLLPPDVLRNPEIAELVEAVLGLAASGLKAVELAYGPDAMHPLMMNGSFEKEVLATYHNGGHTRRMMMTDSLAYARMCRIYDGSESFSDEDLVLLVLASSMHDVVQGNGRGNDERQSAELARDLMRQSPYAFTEEQMDKAYYGILATSFDQETHQQSVDPNQPHLHIQKAIAIGDLLTLCRPDAALHGIELGVEELMLRRTPYGQALSREAAAAGFDLQGKSVLDCLEFIGQSPTLREVFGRFLDGTAKFYDAHRYPDSRVDEWFPGRRENATFFRWLVQKYQAGELSPVQLWHTARERAVVSMTPTAI